MEHKNSAVIVGHVNVILVIPFSVHKHSTGLISFEFEVDVIFLLVVYRFVVSYSDVALATGADTSTCEITEEQQNFYMR